MINAFFIKPNVIFIDPTICFFKIKANFILQHLVYAGNLVRFKGVPDCCVTTGYWLFPKCSPPPILYRLWLIELKITLHTLGTIYDIHLKYEVKIFIHKEVMTIVRKSLHQKMMAAEIFIIQKTEQWIWLILYLYKMIYT